MKLKTLYETVVKIGMSRDPRPRRIVRESLKNVRKEYSKAKGLDKKVFDKERIKHPYDDTRILFGGDVEVKNVLVGIDIGVGEILLADRLREKGTPVDLVISHHPSARALAQLTGVMNIQPGIWQQFGLTEEVAQGIMKDRIGEVSRSLAPSNLTQTLDAARLLGIPFMCCHTAADNCVTNFLQDIFDKKRPGTLKNILEILKGMPEYRHAAKIGNGPFILIGDEKKRSGRVFVDMTGGTSGPDRMYSRLSQAGVGTIVGMHCKETAYKTASAEFINYVIAGHIASDNLGMNLLFDSVEKRGRLNLIECSGFKRFKRK